uniref:Uncharacterized protein n=1 Tax=Ixodes ricinus TaxID=34613 RepID=A0A6B0UNV7_IXORI
MVLSPFWSVCSLLAGFPTVFPMVISSAYIVNVKVDILFRCNARGAIVRLNIISEITLPWGTPISLFLSPRMSPVLMEYFLCFRNSFTKLSGLCVMSPSRSAFKIASWGSELNALHVTNATS